MFAIKTILMPTDFSPFSDEALMFAIRLAKSHNASLHLVHAVPKTFSLDDAQSARLAKALDSQQQLYNLLPDDQSILNVHRQILEGSPAGRIVNYASQHNVDLIVMGTHGRTGISHALVGSVAEKVMRSSSCPVLVVRPHKRDFKNAKARASEVLIQQA